MTITINQLESGMALLVEGNLYVVSEYHHVKPGKGSAFARVKLKNIKTEAVLDRTFRSSDKLEDIVLEEKRLEFLYASGDEYHFMDHSTYEETVISRNDIADAYQFLPENLEVTAVFYNQKILKIVLPTFITVPITETEPGIRGDSSRSGNKPARIETGAVIQVPLFINTGDWIKIDTRSGTYVERIQK